MGKYTSDAKELLKYIGGKSNISAVSHCVTRMRFILNDASKADIKKIESLKSVKGTFTQAGQFQVIIGNTVDEFYKDFTEEAGIEGVSKEAVKAAAKQNQNVLQRIVTALAEIFAPLIPAIITGGLILGFRNCIDSLYLFEGGTKTLVEISQFWAGIDSFLWLIGEAVFHMLPVGICWSVTKKMGTTQILGIILGLTLVSGQLLNAYGVAGTAAEEIPKWNFGFIQVNMIGYQAQVIPAILAAFCLVYLEKFFKKITPAVISMVVVPFASILLAVMAAHFILGPIGWKIGSAVSSVVYSGITGSFKVAFGALFGFFYAPLVITGLHHMSNAIDLQLIADYQGTMLWPMIALSNIAQGSAVLGMVFMQRKNAKAQEVNIPACISCYMGVTEPAMFGVNLKYKYPFLCGMIGSAIAAVICVATGSTANAIGVGGLPGILSIKPAFTLPFFLCMIIAIAIPFLLTVLMSTRRLSTIERFGDDAIAVAHNSEPEASEQSVSEIVACVSGEVISVSEVPDKVFSEKVLGDGIAINPENNILTAPCDGKVAMIAKDTGHACGLKLSDGMEILMHIGLDTVEMQGNGFECYVHEGEQVSKGDKLISFDIDKIKAAGHSPLVIMVISNKGKAEDIKFNFGMKAEGGKTTVAKLK